MYTFTRSARHHSSRRASRMECAPSYAALLLSSLALASPTASAQAPGPLPVASLSEGARIRVTPSHRIAGLQADGMVIGTVQRVTSDSITFATAASAPITLAFAQVAALETSEGTRRRRKRGMSLGLAVGALGGGLLGLSGGDGFIFSAEEAAVIGAAMFGVMGSVAGGLIGLGVTSDVWRPVVRFSW